MKKIISIISLFLILLLISGCELSEQEQIEIGNQIHQSLSTIKGEESVILHFNVQYTLQGTSENLDYDILINKTKNYQSLQMMGYLEEPYQDYRYIIEDPDTLNTYYYEYNTISHSFSKSLSIGKTDYVYDKLSFGQYDVPNLTLSMENVIDLINTESLGLTEVHSEDAELSTYTLFDVSIHLNYLIDQNPDALIGLYGDKVIGNTASLRDLTQTIHLGFDSTTAELKYFEYNQSTVCEALHLTDESVDLKIYIIATGSQAETQMVDLENSDFFPKE